MSTEIPSNMILLLSPEMIEIDESINVRPFSAQHPETSSGLDELIKSIEENGQEQPVGVRKNGENGKYKLTWGSRRLRVITLLNAGRESLLPVKAIIDTSPDPFKAAFDENDKRQQMSPMDKALNFKRKRELEKWTGPKGDKKLAEYFGVSQAQVVQLRKLESLDLEQAAQVHAGIVSMDAALRITGLGKDLPEAERKELQKTVLQDAAAIEESEQAAPKKMTSRSSKKRQAKGGKKAISAESVKKAARAQGEKISRSRKVILEWFEGENGPAYKEHVQEFLTYFLKWADGKGTDRTLGDKFQAAVGPAGLSTQKELKASKAVTHN